VLILFQLDEQFPHVGSTTVLFVSLSVSSEEQRMEMIKNRIGDTVLP
jgi:hypothetical protein